MMYLREVIREDFDEARVRSYWDNGPEMVRYLTEQADVHFQSLSIPDYYYGDKPGGKPGYRALEPAPFDAQKLGREFDRLREHLWHYPAPRINTGDGIRAGQIVGADTSLMAHVWGAPTVHVPGQEIRRALFIERTPPGCLLVNRLGKRFVNEAAPYPDIVHAMYGNKADRSVNIPAWLIFDTTYRKNYSCGVLLPSRIQPDSRIPQGWLDRVIYRAETLVALAAKIDMDAVGLVETVRRMATYAATGIDLEFGKGNGSFDRYYCTASKGPNPCLGPAEKPPFYAVRVYPGELGTKGGLRTDQYAHVLRANDTPIEGLYAIGNCAATVMGKELPRSQVQHWALR